MGKDTLILFMILLSSAAIAYLAFRFQEAHNEALTLETNIQNLVNKSADEIVLLLKDKVKDLEKALQSRETENVALTTRMQISETKVKSAEDNIQLLKEKVAHLEKDIGHGNDKIPTVEPALQLREADSVALTTRMQKSDVKAKSAEDNIELLKQKVGHLEKALQLREADSVALTARMQKSDVKAKSAEDNIALLKQKVGHLEKDKFPQCDSFWESFGRSCYFFEFQRKKSWNDALKDCKSKNAHLITINDSIEQWFIKSYLRNINSNDVYIGFHDTAQEGKFVWEDGSSSKFTFWMPKEPNNYKGIEDCTVIHGADRWNDIPCSSVQGYICEKK